MKRVDVRAVAEADHLSAIRVSCLLAHRGALLLSLWPNEHSRSLSVVVRHAHLLARYEVLNVAKVEGIGVLRMLEYGGLLDERMI